MAHIVERYLESISLGERQQYKNLTVFPLIGADSATEDYLLLDEALAGGFFKVTEVSEGGSVPDLRVINNSSKPVLLLDGEELVGAKQNRVLNTSMLIGGKSVTVIPVSCVEQGRWSYRSAEFVSEGRVMQSSLRAEKAASVMASLEFDKSYRANQKMIWDGIEEKMKRRGVRSSSMAMADIYKQERRFIEEYRAHFKVVEKQIGAMFCINGRVAGIECFGKTETFAKVFWKILDSYALDAVDWLDTSRGSWEMAEDAQWFLTNVAKAPVKNTPAIGLGTDIRFETEEVIGFALAHEECILHFAAFAKAGKSNHRSRYTRMRHFST